jgi:tetratricopeptide (TPR) repeat protein
MKKGLLLAAAAFILFSTAAPAAETASSRDYRSADRLFAAERYSEALALYTKALSTPPDNLTPGDINSKIGDTYFRLGSYRSALDAYRKAVRDQRPADRPQTQYWIGFCCYLVGRDAEAVDEFLKIPALYPEARVWGSTAYYWAGRASERMGKKEQAAEYYRKAGGSSKSTQGKFAQKKAAAVREANTK